MITTAALTGAGAFDRVSDLRNAISKTLLAQNPGLKLIDQRVQQDDARLSTYGKAALALDDFRAFAAGLTGGKLGMVASATGSALTARLTAAGASAGKYAVDVQQLAQGQQLTSKAVAGKDALIGSGAGSVITVETGSGGTAKTTTVKIEAGNNSLDGIARAMREAGLDAQVGADGKGGYALTLNGKSGAANAMQIKVAGDPALQAMFSYQPGSEGGMTQTAAAQDARVVVDGKTVTAATNTLDAAIPGLSLTLKATGKSEVGISSEATSATVNIKDFVKAFNAMSGKLGALQSGDGPTDRLLKRVQDGLGGILGGANGRALADIGITRGKDGLALDEDKLNAALAADPAKVNALFSGKDGLAERLVAQVGGQLGDGGQLARQAEQVTAQRDKLLGQKNRTVDTVNRQSYILAQQYQLIGSGGDPALGGLGAPGRPASLFDYLA